MLGPRQEIDDGAAGGGIPHREENIMAVAVALDHDLVRVAPQHRASPPAIATVPFIAETDGTLAQIDLPFEGIEFAIPIHKKHLFLPYCPFFFSRRHGVIGPLPSYPPPAWCANCA